MAALAGLLEGGQDGTGGQATGYRAQWQHTTSYGYRIGGGDLPIGGAIVTCSGGRYTVDKLYYNWPRRQYTTI